jgi:hypothetical protein
VNSELSSLNQEKEVVRIQIYHYVHFIVGVFISAGLQMRQQVAGLCGGGGKQDLTS